MKRYFIPHDGITEEHEHGYWIKYEDYAAILAVAKEALEFYANWESWRGSHGAELPPDTDYDKGKIAREASAKIGEMER